MEVIRKAVRLVDIEGIFLLGVALDSEDVQFIVDNCPNLKVLGIQTANTVPDEEMSDLDVLERGQLREVSLRGDIVSIIAGLKELEGLLIQGVPLDTGHLGPLASLKSLRQLDIEYSGINDETLRPLGQLSALQQLDIGNTEVTGSGLRYLVGCRDLMFVNMASSKANGNLVRHFAHHRSPRLRQLGVYDVKLSPDEMQKLKSSLPFTEVIDVEDFEVSTRKFIPLLKDPQNIRLQRHCIWAFCHSYGGQAQFKFVQESGHSRVTTLGVIPGKMAVENWAIQLLGEIKGLEVVDLRESDVDDNSLAPLSNLASLRSLTLASTKVSDAGMVTIGKLKMLDYLVLRGTSVTSEGVEHLASLSRLKVLFLGSTQIDDDAMATIAKLSELEKLELANCEITDEGAKHLIGMKNLKRVQLKGTKVSAECLKQIKEQRPDLLVDH
ncbi:MAG: hypothetical protein R3C18_16180 [Planctomycetaceae bacterium]